MPPILLHPSDNDGQKVLSVIFPAEIWMDIVGYAGRYQVSSEGRVRNKHGRIFSPMRGRRVPYLSVVLIGPDGVARRKLVHLLVLEAFIGPRPNGLVARHLNGRASDNRPVNLAWGTVADNVRDRRVHGTENIGERNPRAKLTSRDVEDIRASKEKQIVLARRYGISAANVSSIISRRIWK